MKAFGFSHSPIDVSAARRALEDPACGGFVSFEGWVRNHNEGQPVQSLEYEAFAALAEKEGTRILTEAREKFSIDRAVCVHRTGHLQIGDLAVWTGVSAAHRDAAFAACRYLIDETKARVPIWKKERYTTGATQWINCATRGDHAGESHRNGT